MYNIIIFIEINKIIEIVLYFIHKNSIYSLMVKNIVLE